MLFQKIRNNEVYISTSCQAKSSFFLYVLLQMSHALQIDDVNKLIGEFKDELWTTDNLIKVQVIVSKCMMGVVHYQHSLGFPFTNTSPFRELNSAGASLCVQIEPSLPFGTGNHPNFRILKLQNFRTAIESITPGFYPQGPPAQRFRNIVDLNKSAIIFQRSSFDPAHVEGRPGYFHNDPPLSQKQLQEDVAQELFRQPWFHQILHKFHDSILPFSERFVVVCDLILRADTPVPIRNRPRDGYNHSAPLSKTIAIQRKKRSRRRNKSKHLKARKSRRKSHSRKQ